MANRKCPGGMRNPWRAGRMCPRLRTVGRQIRAVIERFIDKHGEVVLKLYDELGKEGAAGTDEELLGELRQQRALEQEHLQTKLETDAAALRSSCRCSRSDGFFPLRALSGVAAGIHSNFPPAFHSRLPDQGPP